VGGCAASRSCLDNEAALVSSAGVQDAGLIDRQKGIRCFLLVVHGKPNPKLRPQL
jgi:hypothetical protein